MPAKTLICIILSSDIKMGRMRRSPIPIQELKCTDTQLGVAAAVDRVIVLLVLEGAGGIRLPLIGRRSARSGRSPSIVAELEKDSKPQVRLTTDCSGPSSALRDACGGEDACDPCFAAAESAVSALDPKERGVFTGDCMIAESVSWKLS